MLIREWQGMGDETRVSLGRVPLPFPRQHLGGDSGVGVIENPIGLVVGGD